MTIKEFSSQIRNFAVNEIPFIFVIDFEQNKPFICRLSETASRNIDYSFTGASDYLNQNNPEIKIFNRYYESREKYCEAFKLVQYHINRGDSYLVNLTFPTRLETNLTLKELFDISRARYKLFFRDEFIVFSPECFIRIIDNHIFSYPMKGTIDASIPGAEEKILNNKKELFEHNTIVDLIRNDISIIAEEVEVTRFRYLDKINTNQKNLLQVSSEIRGKLHDDWKAGIDEIILNILPAGSVSGAPKQKTIEIIKEAEKIKRGYYTGIFGIFDGKDLDSAVCIRYIEKTDNGLQFRSGGGITALSDLDSEYQEMKDKVYVPIA